MAILGDEVFLGTLNAHVIALDAKTGNAVWDVTATDYRTGHGFTVAPLTVKDVIVIGASRREYGARVHRRYGKEFVAIAAGSGLYAFGRSPDDVLWLVLLLSAVHRVPPIDGAAGSVIICAYTGKEVVG
jgi:outer membrane protein assembly factor BamB